MMLPLLVIVMLGPGCPLIHSCRPKPPTITSVSMVPTIESANAKMRSFDGLVLKTVSVVMVWETTVTCIGFDPVTVMAIQALLKIMLIGTTRANCSRESGSWQASSLSLEPYPVTDGN
jgi:hypothetical protein